MSRVISFDKVVWNEEDFDQMSWHDNAIYAMSFDKERYELAFDIDYVVEWMKPEENDSNYSFWVAPATLVFRNVYGIELHLHSLNVEIVEISRAEPKMAMNADYIDVNTEYKWLIDTVNGEIEFKSVGYNQYLRMLPLRLDTQKVDFDVRGGISFGKKLINDP